MTTRPIDALTDRRRFPATSSPAAWLTTPLPGNCSCITAPPAAAARNLLADSDDPHPLVQGEGITTFGVNEVARAGGRQPSKENNR